ncbi:MULTISPECIES: YjcZ family sporulation protein [Lysinibacillus]|nr:YjcZ family sporulation protein [Lysinibacillus sp. JNUCC-51]
MSKNCGGYGGSGYGTAFALLVVLFILLIIIGAAFLFNSY